jgi:hypothetical protein
LPSSAAGTRFFALGAEPPPEGGHHLGWLETHS